MGTLCPDRASLADRSRELDRDDGVARPVMVRGPGATALSLWTDGLLAFPVELELGDVVALTVAGLPTTVPAQWADDRESQLALAVHQPASFSISRIDEVFCR